MTEFSGQPGPSNGQENAPMGGNTILSIPGSTELSSQGVQPYSVTGLTYPPQYVAPAAAAQQEQLRQFWLQQMQEIHQVGTDPAEFKNHQLPLARIKKIMKSDEDVRMISAEAPVLFARACEMFILELTLRSWNHSEENKRRTLQRNDIAAAITRTDIFDFLVDIVPREERGEEPPVPPAATAGIPRPVSGGGLPAIPAANPQPLPSNPVPAAGLWPQQAPGNPSAEQIAASRQPAPLDQNLVQYYIQHQQQQQQQQRQQQQLAEGQHQQQQQHHQQQHQQMAEGHHQQHQQLSEGHRQQQQQLTEGHHQQHQQLTEGHHQQHQQLTEGHHQQQQQQQSMQVGQPYASEALHNPHPPGDSGQR